MNALKNISHIYFLGIGGIGMSALARYFHASGIRVSGYDRTRSPLTETLSEMGIGISYVDDPATFPAEVDLVVYTPAVPAMSLLRQMIAGSEIPMAKRSEVLGWLSEERKTIAIAGTHGKTTTTAILSHLLYSSGQEVMAFVGGILSGYDTNYLYHGDKLMVTEADEFDRSFLRLSPDIAIVLSMDPDHLDIYGAEDEFIKGFKDFIHRIRSGGHLLINGQLRDKFTSGEYQDLLKKYSTRTFGRPSDDIYFSNLRVTESGHSVFDYHYKEDVITDIEWQMPGNHNASNAVAAIYIARLMGLRREEIKTCLFTFAGIKRRFEFLVNEPESVFIDDYAHHPTELNAAVSTVKGLYPYKKVMGIFQPHLYSRTRDFVDEFARALDRLDYPVLTDIYPARELPIPGVSSDLIFSKMCNANKSFIPYNELLDFLKAQQPEVLITLGAGDIDRLLAEMKQIMLNKSNHG